MGLNRRFRKSVYFRTVAKPLSLPKKKQSLAPVNFLAILEHSPKLLGLLAIFISISALIHEWGFYSALGIELSQSPIGVSDQFKNLLALIPSVLGNTSFILVPAMLIAGLGENSKKRHIGFWSSLNNPYIFFAKFILIIVFSSITLNALKPISNFSYAAMSGLIILATCLILMRDLLSGPEGNARYIAILITFLLYMPFWIFSAGQESAYGKKTSSTVTVFFKEAGAAKNHKIQGTLLRSYEKHLLLRTTNGQIIFESADNVERIEIEPPLKSVGLICIWLESTCE
ncbi:MAG: hypothetical protein ABIP34_22240 [Rhodoferax sp.]|uniref:hypothetical protein n=1 Tax=Rhodoferax sp. TaxID=50421 RepID=UPI003266875A